MKKIVMYLLPIVTLGCFILIMTSATYLKQPTGDNDNIVKLIKEIKEDVTNERWADASEKGDSLYEAWDTVSKRVQFSAERNELLNGQTNIARVNGYIEAENKAGVFSELSELKEHWDDIGK
ncbi:MAG: DUF4363 family protein [Aminipila sp.]